MSAALRVLVLRPQTVKMLRRPINGRGGFQALMRRIQAGLKGRQLTVDADDLDALVRAVSGPAAGGFQRRARELVVDALLHELAPAGPRLAVSEGRVLPFARVSAAIQDSLPFDEDAE